MQSPDQLEPRIEKIESALGITGMNSPATLTHEGVLDAALPVGMIVVTQTAVCPLTYGTWALQDSGPLLGGQVGTVYAWKRTE